MIKKIVLGSKLLRKPSVAYCANHGLLPGVFVRTRAAKLRELMLLPESPHETQLNQDIFALLVNRFRPGFFVEIGGNDGFTLSNTIYLEERFGWNGLLVEANPQYLDSLKKRKSKVVIAAVVEEEGYYEFCSAGLYGGLRSLLDKTHEKMTQNASSITVWGATLRRILEENGAPERISFISIDVEGAEVPIVEQMCSLRNYRFLCGCIEYNARQADYQRITHLLKESGYRVVWEGQTQHDLFFVDEGVLAGNG
ncbi:MAG: FkbM family methyltransferase [Pseudomonadota bacterium]